MEGTATISLERLRELERFEDAVLKNYPIVLSSGYSYQLFANPENIDLARALQIADDTIADLDKSRSEAWQKVSNLQNELRIINEEKIKLQLGIVSKKRWQIWK